MNQEDTVISRYQKLSRGVYGLLHRNFGIPGDRTSLWQSFDRNLIEILRIALDVSVTPGEVQQFHAYLQGRKPNQAEMMSFWRDALERPQSYLVISYFYTQCIKLFAEYVPVEKQTEYAAYLASVGVTEELLAEVEQEYQLVVSK